MKLSVITVCLNSRGTIAEAVASVHRQTHSDIEHIVVDGASTDGTLEALEPYRDRIARLISERDEGLYFAMNKGIEAATGEYIGFLNSDDVYVHDSVLARVAEALEQGRWDSAYGDLVYVDAADTTRLLRYWKSRPYRDGLVEAGWVPAHPTFFVRATILKEIGGFDTRYRYQSDFEIMIRLFIQRRISSVYIPNVLVRMRTGGHTNRSLRNIVRGNLEAYAAARMHGIARSPFWILSKLRYRAVTFFMRPRSGDRSSTEGPR